MKKYFLYILNFVAISCFSQSNLANFKDSKSQQQISFTENKGQVSDQNYKARPDVLFSGTDGKLVFHLKNDGISYQLSRVDSWKKEDTLLNSIRKLPNEKPKLVPDKNTIYRLDINWLNANTNSVVKKGKAFEGYNNYYLESCPNGALEVKSYEEVTYQQIYNGIDLKWYQKDGHLKYDYVVAARADYKQIQLEIKGTERISLNNKGELILRTPLGDIIEQAPIVIQDNKVLKSRWIIKNNIVSFDIDDLDAGKEFLIDPAIAVRIWGTYYGGTLEDRGYCTYIDTVGNVFICGITVSTANIATSGSYQTLFAGGGPFVGDAFLAKFNAAGVRQWGTYYGGSDSDSGFSISNDNSGCIYLSGTTTSTASIATIGAHQTVQAGSMDGFLVKFNSLGIRLWATYYGDSFLDNGLSNFTDSNDNVYLAGTATCNSGTAIATPGSHQAICGGAVDGYLVKFNSNGVRQWGTYFGGINDQYLKGTIDRFDNIYLVGETKADVGAAIATPGSHQPSYGGGAEDGFLAKFNTSGTRLWGTYYGGTGSEQSMFCCTDTSGNIYISGGTTSNTASVIATPGSHQPTFGGGSSDAFLVKFDPNGVRQWGTYYGGTGYDWLGLGCAHKTGNIYFPGITGSNAGTAIATPSSHQSLYGGGVNDGFLVKFDNSGQRQWGTYYGGSGEDHAVQCSVDSLGNIYIIGQTASIAGITTIGAHQSNYGGGVYDGFFAKFNDCSLPAAPNNITPVSNLVICANSIAVLSASATGIIAWFTSATGGVAVGTGSVFFTPPLILTSTYYAEALTCSNSLTRTAISVTVNQLPNIIASSNASLICTGQTTTLTASGANTFSWSSAATGSNISVSPTITTNYTVTGMDANGCQNVATITQSVSLCTNLISSINNIENDLLIYPNPTTDIFTIELNEPSQVIIYNALGQIIYNEKHLNLTSEVSLLKFSNGIYLIQILDKEKIIYSGRIIKN